MAKAEVITQYGKGLGAIAIAAYTKEYGEDYLFGKFPSGQYVCLEVPGSGCGIEQVTIAKIFDLFCTTKSDG